MTASIVSTVTAASMDELRAARDRQDRADLVELRLDGVRGLDVEAALAGRMKPVIITCRPTWEGGRFDGSEEERGRILHRAVELGAEYVDVEWRAGFDDLVRARGGRGVVLSLHDFEGVPADLADQYAAMRATGAAIVKIAVTARRLTDCLALADACAGSAPRALIAMGQAGIATRVLPSRFGSCWTYAGHAAPGQVPLDTLLDRFRVRLQSDATAIYGLAGAPTAHSLSPAIHNANFAAAGLDAVYLPLEAASVDDFVAFATDPRIDLRGASVTAPFKVAALAILNERDGLVDAAGTVNTLRRDARAWSGRNTDIPALSATLPPEVGSGSRAAVLGAGGAARAAVFALRDRGAIPVVHTRRPNADGVFDDAGTPLRSGLPTPGSWDVLVNATPVGTFPAVEETPMPAALLTGSVVYDLVYNPPITRLQRDASAAGCTVVGGLEMLLRQAELQATWWTDQAPSAEAMRRAALAPRGRS
jgi:3-dehydroquinate dehydratase/shikimate dehydrogenase